MKKLLDGYCRLLDFLMAAALATMVALVFGNVVLRYGFNSGIAVSEEMSRWLFLWLTFMGAVVALKDHGHLGTDMLVARLPRLGKKLCLILAQVVMLYLTWLVLQGAWAQTVINLDVQAPVTGASVAIFYATGVFFGISGIVILLYQLWRLLSGQTSEAEMAAIKSSEEAAQAIDLPLPGTGNAAPR